ncbi:DUF654-domain-containing protein [Annulohypoxylon truncatum]|uniref:DUF654-domain-containing protein n=1 Tax=Annulohypoxylon truncatum TaxID=327061 RepID=UPI0020085F35|nr:DUF654-domain-containing protein [Annulohypoxylon truncatum]KAI1210739.1 DUF654-domain-containing protein [Annulohypoxylon truncatum]
MSSRQLRKLQKQKELQELEAQNAAQDDESSEDNQPAQKPRASLFSGLAALEGHDEDDDDVDLDEKDDESTKTPVIAVAEPDKTNTNTPKSASKKSKKKKKKAKKQDASPSKPETASHNGPDEIDQALKELDLSKKPGQETRDDAFTKPYERICELLSINTYHLRVINEMRNLFGREAIAAAQTEEEQDQTRSRRQRHALPREVDLETFLRGTPGKSLPEVTLRRNPFLAGKESWPRAPTEGLTMEQLKEEEEGSLVCMPGIIEFRFAHDEKYNSLERAFFELVQMYQPSQLVQFLHHHPYHISSLIQVSRIAKQDQNSALSADLCERALFTFGRVSLSAFRQRIEQGKARLSFRRPENRQFWLAGYHYLKNLIMKGTYRTALEWAKLLLSLDHSDPYGVMHYIHPLAIRAHESKWFIDFCDSELLEVDAKAQDSPDYVRQTLVLAKLQQNDMVGAKALLLEGMERLPWLYGNLFKSLNLSVPPAVWGIQPRNRDEELHTNVYIHQTKDLWDNKQATTLLQEVAKEAKKADPKKCPFPPTVKDNFARFVYLLEIPSLIGLIPRDMLNSSTNWEFDPLPPALDRNIFSHESQRRPWTPSSLQERFGDRLRDGDRHDLGRLVAQARLAGAPIGVQQDLENALEEALLQVTDDDDTDAEFIDDSGEDDEEDGSGSRRPNGGLGGIFQAFMDLFDPRGLAGDGDIAESDLEGMPGGWRDLDSEDSDGEMPPLISADDDDEHEHEQHENGGNRDDNGSGDDMSDLV